MIQKRNKKKTMRLLCLLLAAMLLCGAIFPGLSASAAGTPTSLGLAQHGLKAYRDGWKYASGAKGGSGSSGTRYSDCAGLIYAYFSDVGALGNCQGGATSQVEKNCVFSNDISEGIPNIHGLVLTMPDYYDPGTGIYGHIGIYVGNNMAADNSDYNYNMRFETVVGNSRNWSAWHVFDNGMKYPVNGWYAMDGKMVHYTNYEYDTNTIIDGYSVNGEGYAEMPGGMFYPVDSSILSNEYASAFQVALYLRTKYSGVDSTADLINGGTTTPDPGYNGRVTGSGVNVRQQATTKSSVVTTLSLGAGLNILSETAGEAVTYKGKTSSVWYSVTTASGLSGYVSALFAERVASDLKAPEITAANGYVTITADGGADIYYTLDCTQPNEKSTPYTAPVFLTNYTFKAVALRGGQASGVTTATVLSNGTVFSDFTTKDWFYTAVNTAVEEGIFHGNGNGTFTPDKNITRMEFVTALAMLDKADLSAYSADTGFTDVPKRDSTMVRAISWASQNGYVKGYDDGGFHPDEPISREQACVILAKYADLPFGDIASPFADDKRISSWAKDAVYACRAAGYINGVGDSKFDPKGLASRAQACVMMLGVKHWMLDAR